MAEEASGFLGRWSRRKIDVREGKPLEEPAPPVIATPTAAPAKPVTVAEPAPLDGTLAAPAEPPKVLSLEDVTRLTAESDFKPFVGRSVAPEVRNAAMKKLFTDPHYNVMDGLDTYIDDYTVADPIPAAMLRQMVGSKLLKIFDHEDKEALEDPQKAIVALEADASAAPEPLPLDNPNNPTAQSVAQSPDGVSAQSTDADPAAFPPQPVSADQRQASHKDHADTHLRLQQNHAASGPSTGRGAA